jgi:hypothetical protein
MRLCTRLNRLNRAGDCDGKLLLAVDTLSLNLERRLELKSNKLALMRKLELRCVKLSVSHSAPCEMDQTKARGI